MSKNNNINFVTGMHSKKEVPNIRLIDLTIDTSKIKQQFLPFWQRALRVDAQVEFVASGSKFRVFIPKDNCLVNFLLMGITCPRSSRPAIGNSSPVEGEPFGDEAMSFVKEKIYQRDVALKVETSDKNFSCIIGWLFLEHKTNLAISLVEEGLAMVHSASAEKSEYYRLLSQAEENAKSKRIKIWKDYVEEVTAEKDNLDNTAKIEERKEPEYAVVVSDVSSDLTFYAQKEENKEKLIQLMDKIQKYIKENLGKGAFLVKKGDVYAARFSDNQWYRAKIEKIDGDKAHIFYIDYGNKEVLFKSELIELPHSLKAEPAFATLFKLALTALPPDEDDKKEACNTFLYDVLDKKLKLQVQYR
jgi:staphylococcal nuclease domain-containing protein 1